MCWFTIYIIKKYMKIKRSTAKASNVNVKKCKCNNEDNHMKNILIHLKLKNVAAYIYIRDIYKYLNINSIHSRVYIQEWKEEKISKLCNFALNSLYKKVFELHDSHDTINPSFYIWQLFQRWRTALVFAFFWHFAFAFFWQEMQGPREYGARKFWP